MNILGPTRFERLNEALGLVFLFAGVFVILSLVSYYPLDPSWNTATSAVKPHNLTGAAGAHISDLLLQSLGLGAFAIPVLLWMLAWRWVRSRPVSSPWIKTAGSALLIASVCVALALLPHWRPWTNTYASGGVLGTLIAEWLIGSFNFAGTAIVTAVGLILSIYIVSTFSMGKLAGWLARPRAWWERRMQRFYAWREARRAAAKQRAKERAAHRAQIRAEKAAARVADAQARKARRKGKLPQPVTEALPGAAALSEDHAPWDEPVPPPHEDEIPIRTLEDEAPAPEPIAVAAAVVEPVPLRPTLVRKNEPEPKPAAEFHDYHLPPTDLLAEPSARSAYDSAELKEIAGRIKSKFEEFNVHGSVVQINPGPVVTTFEFKPEAGVKYSRITTLTEDLCLGLQAESILIERIPGKPTVGIEVPNSRREVISLRQIIESDEFQTSGSKLTISLGKDISGRIKATALESMPHLLIAGSTGSGKSVMLNTLIMSVLYKATPDEVRMIMVDPKRVELGIYEGIPHLLTPVITDPKKATNALRNAVLEMERRLKLLASHGVRNIDQFNKKVRALQNEPRNLFEEAEPEQDELKPLPYILILIDELADLMMLERAGVEESVTRLAQMARAVGMHLVLATQRPSVDVITGLIKANFPSRISFRVATRVDSRTVLDVMGAEHLLGKGDMLFLPPGSSRLVRVHGAFVTETETSRVVEFWKEQARPEYDQTFLLAPPEEGEGDDEAEDLGPEDAMYQDAVRVVCEMGKASTSTLQRRLRLGYGRAARILDMMQRDGIIGPPDGSKPRDVLKRPDWLQEIDHQLR